MLPRSPARHGATPPRWSTRWLFSVDLVRLLTVTPGPGCAATGTSARSPPDERARLGAELDPLLERYRALWLRRNRSGGLEDSLTWLQNLRSAYASGRPDPRWGGISAPEDWPRAGRIGAPGRPKRTDAHHAAFPASSSSPSSSSAS